MGRKLYRVPLDFNWPLNKVWEGFLNPHYAARVDCAACVRSGYAPEAKRISDQWYGIAPFDPVAYGAKPLTIEGSPYLRSKSPEEARRLLAHYKGQWSHHLIQADVDALVAAGRLFDFTRRPRTPEQAAALQSQGGYWMAEWNGYTPTADEINEWGLGGLGHDGINQWACVQARCAREGVELSCPHCLGEGYTWPSPEAEARYEAWTSYDPPVGIGWQLWETTSEGSPISPVFPTLDGLCAYAAINCSTFGSHKASPGEWKQMLDDGFVSHTEDRADGGKLVFI